MRFAVSSLRGCLATIVLGLLVTCGTSVVGAETKDSKGQAASKDKSAKSEPKKEAKATAKDTATPDAKDAKKKGHKDSHKQKDEKAADKPADKEADKAAKETKEKDSAKKEKDSSTSKDATDDSKTHRVKKGPFKIEVTLDGAFGPEKMTELILRPEEWTAFLVAKAVEHGSTVKKGDVLLTVETEKIDRVIADLESDIRLSDLGFKQAEQQLALAEKSTPLDLEAARRARRISKEDRKQFFDVEKPMSVKITDFSLQMAKDILEYQEEELRQLEKMYKADDLTEDTEKIVLKRTRDNVKRAKFNLEYTQAMYDEARKFTLPRNEERINEMSKRAAMEWKRTKDSLPLNLSKQRLEFEKLKVQREQTAERLKNLKADRATMVVKSPADGIVYYGKYVRGKWTGSAAGDMFRQGAGVMVNDVFMTIVQPRPLVIRATVPEAKLQDVRQGVTGLAEPTGFKDLKLPVAVKEVTAIPLASGTFDAELSVTTDAASAAIMPGMNCEVKLMSYKKPKALTVPIKTVFTEELDPLTQYVYLVKKNGKSVKRGVTLGRRNDKDVEILEGLSVGDRILLEQPKDD